MQAVAIFKTAHAARYLGQFVSHFAHKLAAEKAGDNGTGSVSFPAGRCALAASPTVLTLTIEAETREDIHRLADVVDRHLVRFAYREPVALSWTLQSAAA
jgi:hypothetical protein